MTLDTKALKWWEHYQSSEVIIKILLIYKEMLSLKLKSLDLFAYDFLRLQNQHLGSQGMLESLWKTAIFHKIQFHAVSAWRNPTWGACCYTSTFKGRWANETARRVLGCGLGWTNLLTSHFKLAEKQEAIRCLFCATRARKLNKF